MGGYWPAEYPDRLALVRRLPDPGALQALRDATGVTTIVLHLDRLREPQLRAWERAVATSGVLVVRARGPGHLIL